jgi:hypothetical protein
MLKTMESGPQKLIDSSRREMQEMMEKATEMERYDLPMRVVKLETEMVGFKEKTIALLGELKLNKRFTLDDKEELYKLARERLNFTIEVDRKIIDWIGQLGEEKLPTKASNSELLKYLNRETYLNRKILEGMDNSPEILEYEAKKELLKELKKVTKAKGFD